jgi:glycosyltransferase involved in cell wall biosynthesis
MEGEQVSVALVVTTRGRVDQLEKLFESLKDQDFKNFEVVIVDQNDDERLKPICDRWQPVLKLRRIWTPDQRGLSRGRNVGWIETQCSLVLFPDDDCWYPSTFLAHGVETMRTMRADILTGRAADEDRRTINGRFEPVAQWINPRNVWTTQIEWVALYKRSALEAVGGFDADIGIGALTPWQACEGQDIVLRALAKGLKCYYDPSFYGHHAELDIYTPDEAMCRKGRMYGRGLGHVLRIHKYKLLSALNWVLRPAVKACFFLRPGNLPRFHYYRNVAVGRWEGWNGRIVGRTSGPTH